MEDGYLKITAEKKDEEAKNDEGYTRKEFSFHSFERSFKLPANVDDDQKVKANYKDGILGLCLTKKEIPAEKPKKVIEIA
ncbi:Hsp20/alpha crystallin family protein [Aquimarina agarivorans]|uniref:Hsp20/alpha crystallin family protein n=1 Tax=Aquimarina agarivorans TaxID=980584 RepID=UPI000248EBBC|nr:Hsp20/alpha crystallin family protein [Aquimarina agarivorans]